MRELSPGYLTLWQRTGDTAWREKAIRAGNDLVEAQLPDGHFRNSAFELNPSTGGTPHEAAADVALLLLAKELGSEIDGLRDRFLHAAVHNLEAYWLEMLWHESTATLWDSPDTPSFVPNKAATFIDALLLWTEITNNTELIERYAIPTAAKIVAMQVQDPTALLDGAIAQNRFGDRVTESYFPLYIARCIPALLQLSRLTGDHLFREAALSAARFLIRVREPDGGLPQVLYVGRSAKPVSALDCW